MTTKKEDELIIKRRITKQGNVYRLQCLTVITVTSDGSKEKVKIPFNGNNLDELLQKFSSNERAKLGSYCGNLLGRIYPFTTSAQAGLAEVHKIGQKR